MYHDIYESNINESGFLRKRDLPYKLNAIQFEEQIKAIKGYCGKNKKSQDDIVFTFDDGGKSFYNIVAPILEKYGFRGIFFVTTQYIGTKTFLSKDEIIKLHQRGHIIGSHAHTHEHMYSLSNEEVVKEWQTSIEILCNILGERINHVSIPNGDVSKRVLEAISNNDIQYVYTSKPTTQTKNYKGMEIIGRYVVLSDSSTEEILSIVSHNLKRFTLYAKYQTLKLIKSVLGSYYVKFKNVIFK